MLQLAEQAYKSVGVLVNEDNIQVTVMHYNGNILEERKKDCSCKDISKAKEAIVSEIKDMQARHGQILGAGIAIPGIVNSDQAIVYESSRLGWFNEPFDLKKEFDLDLPIFIQNRVRMNALQSLEQTGTMADSIFFLQVSEGVGGAFVKQHQLLSGGSWTAGEVGHIPVSEHGPQCPCGQTGCLEVMISELAFSKRLEQINEKRLDLPLTSFIPDQVADIAADFGNNLGKALIYIMHLMNPDQIIIDSPYNKSKAFTDACLEKVQSDALRIPAAMTEITFSEHKYDQVTGAALAVFFDFEHGKF
nr:ROK family protein [Gracilibacillus alcaliphilus]